MPSLSKCLQGIYLEVCKGGSQNMNVRWSGSHFRGGFFDDPCQIIGGGLRWKGIINLQVEEKFIQRRTLSGCIHVVPECQQWIEVVGLLGMVRGRDHYRSKPVVHPSALHQETKGLGESD